jgi:hypothetical protein
MRIYWFAWGGADITNVETGQIAEPAATGNQDYTLSGAFEPQAVIFAGCQLTGAAPTAASIDGGWCFGAATGPTNQWVMMGNSDQGSTTMDTDGYSNGDECLGNITVAGGNPSARASFVQFNSDGFRLNWLVRATTGRKYIFIAIRGGQWRAGDFVATLNLNDTATVSGLPFRPKGTIFGGAGAKAEHSSAGGSSAHSYLQVGSWEDNGAGRQASEYLSENGTGNAEVDLINDQDSVIIGVSTIGAQEYALDVQSVADDGFTLVVDDGLGPISSFVGYLAFGDAPAPDAGSWHMPATPGLSSLRARGREFWSKAAKPLIWGDFNEGPVGQQPDTDTHSTKGVGALRLHAKQQWSAAVSTWPYGSSDTEEETAPFQWAPAHGGGSLRAGAAAFWKRAAAVSSTWFGSEQTSQAEEGFYTQDQIPGVLSLRAYGVLLWRAALPRRRLHEDRSESAPVENQSETWTQDIGGIGSLRRTATRFWQQAARPIVWGEGEAPAPAVEPEASQQSIGGILALRHAAERYQARAVQSSQLGSVPAIGGDGIVLWMWRRIG